MPTYEFQCECGEQFDRICSMEKARSKSKCPKCGKLAGRRWTKPNIRISHRLIDNSPRRTRGRGY